jgi:hypothetical protein
MNQMGLAYIGVVSLFMRVSAGIVLALLLAPAAEATQYSATGTIGTVQMYSTTGTNASEAGSAMFQVSSGLGNGCNWLYVIASDTNTLAALMTAKVSAANVTVVYDNTLTPPWGTAGVCGAQVIQLN